MEGLKMIPYIALVIAITGIILGATVIMQSEMRDTMTTCFNSSYSYNTSIQNCEIYNGSGQLIEGTGTGSASTGNFSQEYYAMTQGIEGSGTISEQVPTVAIIAVMVIIISVIAGVFVYIKYFS